MALNIPNLQVPLTIGEDGIARVRGGRITLDQVISEFEDGAIADEIALHLHLSLPDVFLILAFYLEQRAEVEAYIKRRQEARKWRDAIPTVTWRSHRAA